MTHKDIYTKFMIEYDKAGASTSYPSLTEYEVATVLDKAYNALIAQKVTGNNYRRSTLESDIKSIADLGPLTKSVYLPVKQLDDFEFASNVTKATMQPDMLYFLQASMKYVDGSLYTPFDNDKKDADGIQVYKYNPADGVKERSVPVKLVNHEIAQKFFASASNIPWIKQPVCFLEDKDLYIVYDPLNPPISDADTYVILSHTDGNDDEGIEHVLPAEATYAVSPLNFLIGMENQSVETLIDAVQEIIPYEDSGINLENELFENGAVRIGIPVGQDTVWYKIKSMSSIRPLRVTYIRRPNTFVKDLSDFEGTVSYFDEGTNNFPEYEFECNSTVAEELISLAVAFALENVESQRLNSKLNMRGLEA